MRRLPPLGAIEAFTAVARTGSVKAAAEMLALSSSAVSRRVQTLEQHLGVPLFLRRHQALVLTETGEALITAMAPALDALSDAIDGATRHEALRLTLSVMPLFASNRLVPRLPSFIAANRGFHLDLESTGRPFDDLGGRIDATIWLVETPDPRFYARQLGQERIVAIAAPALAERIRTPDAITDLPILVHRDMPRAMQAWVRAKGLSARPGDISVYDSGQLILDATAAGLGVAFLLETLVEGDQRVVPLFDDEEVVASPYNYWFMCRRHSLAQRPVRIFHDWLVKQFPG